MSGLTKIFGQRQREGLDLLDAKASRADIQQRTGCVIGLEGVNFAVQPGEILVVMGLSGSGKSTTLRCVNRLIDPTRGRVTVHGTDVTSLSTKALRDFRRTGFGMVFQQFALFPHRTILGNVEYGLEVQGMAPALRRDKAMAAIEQVGLKGWAEARPSQLSGGMQQRAGLARALAADADILLMDEAFSALDPLIRRDMQRELVALQDKLKKTILFVTHDLDEAIALGGRIILMRDGRIVQEGRAIDFLLDPADDYVMRFVEHIDMFGIMTVEAAMMRTPCVMAADQPVAAMLARVEEGVDEVVLADPDGRYAGRLSANAIRAMRGIAAVDLRQLTTTDAILGSDTLGSALPRFSRDVRAIPVVDRSGNLIGQLTDTCIISAIAQQRRLGATRGAAREA